MLAMRVAAWCRAAGAADLGLAIPPHHRQVQVKVGDKATEMAARIAGALKSARTLGHNPTHHTKATKKENTVNRRKSARQPCGRRGRSAHTS